MLPTAYEGHAQRARTDREAGYIDITQYRSAAPGKDAVPPVIERIEQLQQRGYAPSDIAILVTGIRKNVCQAYSNGSNRVIWLPGRLWAAG